MKKSFLLTTVSLLLIISACSHNSKGNMPKWPSVSKEIDSLTRVIECSFLLHYDSDSIAESIDRLRGIKGTEDRTDIFQARLYRQMGMSDSSSFILKRLRERVDSGKSPYLWARLRLSEMRHYDNDFEEFKIITQSLRYYRQIGDSLMLASTLVDMANLMYRLKLYKQSLKFLNEGQAVYDAIGLGEIHVRCDINKALVLRQMDSIAEADSIEMRLYKDESLLRDTVTRELVLRNIHLSTGDIQYILEDYEMMKNVKSAKGLMPLLENLVASAYRQNNIPDSANHYSRMAFNSMSARTFPKFRKLIYDEYSKTLESEGKLDSACIVYRKLILIKDSLDQVDQTVEIVRLESNSQIAEYEQKEAQRKRVERLLWTTVVVTLLLILAIGSFIGYRKQQKGKLREIESQLSLEQNRRHLAARVLAMEEKDKLLSAMSESLKEMRQNPDDSTSLARELENMIKLHTAGQEEWQNFVTIFEKLNPDFMTNIKKRCPGLADNYVKLASYIYAGLTNNQIAKLLMIRPESVHQARWRLRRNLKLPKHVTIEDALRALAVDPDPPF